MLHNEGPAHNVDSTTLHGATREIVATSPEEELEEEVLQLSIVEAEALKELASGK